MPDRCLEIDQMSAARSLKQIAVGDLCFLKKLSCSLKLTKFFFLTAVKKYTRYRLTYAPSIFYVYCLPISDW